MAKRSTFDGQPEPDDAVREALRAYLGVWRLNLARGLYDENTAVAYQDSRDGRTWTFPASVGAFDALAAELGEGA